MTMSGWAYSLLHQRNYKLILKNIVIVIYNSIPFIEAF